MRLSLVLSLRRREDRKIVLAEAQRRGGKDLAYEGDGVEGASKNGTLGASLTYDMQKFQSKVRSTNSGRGKQGEAKSLEYFASHYTLAEVGAHFGVSYAMVSRAVKAVEKK